MPDAKTPHEPKSTGQRRPSAASPTAFTRATAGIEANPLALVAGGLVLGAIAGAFVPRSDKERELLAPLGTKISTALAAALDAGRDAGKAELDGLGLNRDAARDQVKTLIDGLLKAASSAGTAALGAAQGKTAD